MPVQRHASVFRAIADETRRDLLEVLSAGEREFAELAARCPMSKPAVAQHLKVLLDAGLVTVRHTGRAACYRLNSAPLSAVAEWAARVRSFADPSGHVWRVRAGRRPGSKETKRSMDRKK
ncbi:MAG TPA: metalloregulator ArsR/SmtB family transcription factor [Vicinamibacterales bacterium]|jgi:DNA-binding transcriptional ArsR family regulator